MAADFVLVPDMVHPTESSGKAGGLFGRLGGHLSGSSGDKVQKTDVVLALTDVRSTEKLAEENGTASASELLMPPKKSAAFYGGFGPAGAISYANTEMGQLVAMAYADAFKKLVAEVDEFQSKDEHE